MAEIRTIKELNDPQAFNYYLAFNLDPKELNPAKIEEAIKKQKSTWTSGSPAARRYIALYQDIINVMVNDVAFDTEKQSYSVTGARSDERYAAKKYMLEKAVKGFVEACNGIVYKSTLSELVVRRRYKWYTVDELIEAIKAADDGVIIIDDTQKVFDFNRYSHITKSLDTIGKGSIYEFLGDFTRSSSAEELLEAADVALDGIQNKTSVNGVATRILADNAKKIFCCEHCKKLYDDYYACKELVWDKLDSLSCIGAFAIGTEKYTEYVDTVLSLTDVTREEAERYVNAGLKHFHVTVIADPTFIEELNLANTSGNADLPTSKEAIDARVKDIDRIYDFWGYKSTGTWLNIIGKESLYEFLEGCTPENTPLELCEAAENVYRNIEKRTSLEGTARQNLVGSAKKVFANAKSKAAYDEYLATKELVWDKLKAINAAYIDTVSVAKYRGWIIDLSNALNLSYAEAEKRILVGMKYYHLHVGR